jgi:hypothetical protein
MNRIISHVKPSMPRSKLVCVFSPESRAEIEETLRFSVYKAPAPAETYTQARAEAEARAARRDSEDKQTAAPDIMEDPDGPG